MARRGQLGSQRRLPRPGETPGAVPTTASRPASTSRCRLPVPRPIRGGARAIELAAASPGCQPYSTAATTAPLARAFRQRLEGVVGSYLTEAAAMKIDQNRLAGGCLGSKCRDRNRAGGSRVRSHPDGRHGRASGWGRIRYRQRTAVSPRCASAPALPWRRLSAASGSSQANHLCPAGRSAVRCAVVALPAVQHTPARHGGPDVIGL